MPRLVASFLGVGLILGRLRGADSGSGTLAALVAGALAYALGLTAGWQAVALGCALLLGIGLWVTSALEPEVGDAGWIVIDEAAGMFLALIGVVTWPAALAAFVVFRLADIFKNWFPGVTAAEHLDGSWGIMGDDLVAGMYGLITGHLIQRLLS